MPSSSPGKRYAIYAITRHGIAIARRLSDEFEGADLFVSQRFLQEAPPGALPLPLPMGPCLSTTFKVYECHVHIISVGAVFRMLAPLLENKKVDPAVVCVDDAARFAICMLSGHVGRGNEFTEQVAEALGATPVITTASDVGGTLTVDILGRELGWTLDHPDKNVTRGCAAVVNGDPVIVVQETGEPNFWPVDKALPKGVSYRTDVDGSDVRAGALLLLVTDRRLEAYSKELLDNAVVYRPRSLVIGMGCDRGASVELLRTGLDRGLAEAGLVRASIRGIATIDQKKDEVGIVALAKELGCPVHCYSSQELCDVQGVESPSEVVRRFVGTPTVAEGACLLNAQTDNLLLPKRRYRAAAGGKNMTLAIARVPFETREVM